MSQSVVCMLAFSPLPYTVTLIFFILNKNNRLAGYAWAHILRGKYLISNKLIVFTENKQASHKKRWLLNQKNSAISSQTIWNHATKYFTKNYNKAKTYPFRATPSSTSFLRLWDARATRRITSRTSLFWNKLWLKEQRRRFYNPDCMIWVQTTPWSRSCVLRQDALRWLSLLGGFEQAANLREKKSNDNQKTWKMVNS